MMKKILITSFLSFLFLFMLTAFIQIPESPTNENSDVSKLFPANVSVVLDNSCFQCHTAGSKNADAKKELNFTKWENLSVIKKVGKLKEIREAVSEEEMPPKKYIAKFPHKKLSEDDVKILVDWVKTESESLVKGLH